MNTDSDYSYWNGTVFVPA